MAGQLRGCAPFPVFAGIGKRDTQLSEIPSFRIQPCSSWGMGSSPWHWWVYYSEGSGLVLSRCSSLLGGRKVFSNRLL